MSAIALAFTSCDDYNFESPDPQSNPQQDILLVENVNKAVSFGGDLNGQATLDLNAFAENADGINVINVSEIEGLPTDQAVDVTMQISLNEDFSDAAEAKVNIKEGKGYVLASEWANIHVTKFSKSPKAKDTYYRFIVSMVKGDQKVRIGDATTFYCSGKTTVTPFPSELVIEESYYLIGTACDWTMTKAIEFSHTGDIYENPIFTLKIDISEAQAIEGWWWKVVPKSTFDTGGWVDGDNTAYGVAENGSELLADHLVARTATVDCGAGCIKTAGQWLITINLEEGTYAFTSAVDFLYTPGQANDWNQGASQKLATTDYANYSGYAVLDPAGFKFSSALDWDHTNYGAGETAGTLSTDPSAGNLSVEAKGLYYCAVDIAGLTYSLTQVTTYGLIGDATPGGWDASTALTPSEDFLIWTGTVKLIAGKEFKFRANDGWDINLGGDLNDLSNGGTNIASPGDGDYLVTLDLSKLPYTATVVKK